MGAKPIYIADTLHNTIQLSELEKKIISTQLFNRLHNISQNSTAYLTFPTNRTKRFEHSIGTMKLCGEMFYYSIGNADNKVIQDFFDDLEKNLKAEFIKNDLKKYRQSLKDETLSKIDKFNKYDVIENLYNVFVPKNISKDNVFLYLTVFQAIRIAALLHDIGHPPFSHIAENAIKKVYSEIKDIEESKLNDRGKLFKDIIDEYAKQDEQTTTHIREKFQLHEKLGNKMAETIIEDVLKEDEIQDENYKYFNILSCQIAIYLLTERNLFFKQIHKLIDGSLDGDRLDYVSRDVINSGFESGRVEYSRLISSMELCETPNVDKYVFCSNIKVLNTVEDFFFRRWKLYKNIVYHHRVIKTDHLLQDSIYEMIKKYLSSRTKEKPAKSGDFRLENNISGLWKPLKMTISNKDYFNALIQWDDGWLLSIMKQYFYSEGSKKENCLKYELEELLSNKKQFYSIIKDSTDFLRIDEKVIENIKIDFMKLNKYAEDLDISFKKMVENIQYKCINNEEIKVGSFLFNVKLFMETFYSDTYNFNDIMKEIIDDCIEKQYKDKIECYFIEFKAPNYGLSKMPYIVINKQVKLLNKVSNIDAMLECNGLNFPLMHIYIKRNKEFKYDIFIDDLAKYIAKELNKFFDSIIK